MGDLFIDKGVDIYRRNVFGRFVTDDAYEYPEVAQVMLRCAALTKTTIEVLLEASQRLFH